MNYSNFILLTTSAVTMVLGIVCILILAIFHRNKTFQVKLLMMALSCIVFIVFNNAIMLTPLVLKWPHFFRTSTSVQYLVAPLFYLYTRSTIREASGFAKWDILHFIPFLVQTIELTPDFALSAEEKKAIYLAYQDGTVNLGAQDTGILPPFVHPVIKSLLGIFYQMGGLWILTKTKRELKLRTHAWKATWNWLLTLVLILLFTYVIVLIQSVFLVHPKFRYALNIPGVVLLAVVSFCLVFMPRLLYGMFDPTSKQAKTGQAMEPLLTPKRQPLTSQKLEEIKQILQVNFVDQKRFLHPGYSLSLLSADTGIPAYIISQFLGQDAKVNFSEFVNSARIEYLIAERQRRPDWQLHTLEALSREAGFSSRVTFINAFKKVKGVTPSQFFGTAKP